MSNRQQADSALVMTIATSALQTDCDASTWDFVQLQRQQQQQQTLMIYSNQAVTASTAPALSHQLKGRTPVSISHCTESKQHSKSAVTITGCKVEWGVHVA